jgi:hypothetical protein
MAGAIVLVAVIAAAVLVAIFAGGQSPRRIEAVGFAAVVCGVAALGGWVVSRSFQSNPAVAVAGDDIDLWGGLLRHAYRDLRRGPWHHAIVSMHEDDPLAVALDGYRAIRAAGRLYVVHYADGADAVAALDDRVPCLDLSRI